MSVLDGVRIIRRERRADPRGWLLKVVVGNEPGLGPELGEVYVVMAAPGEVRGNHHHERTAEWFTVIDGEADLLLRDVRTRERQTIRLRADEPTTVHVPPGIAHAFRNPPEARQPMLLIAYADRRYDPADTIPADLLAAPSEDGA